MTTSISGGGAPRGPSARSTTPAGEGLRQVAGQPWGRLTTQAQVKSGWQVPERPAGVASARDLHAAQRGQQPEKAARRRPSRRAIVAGTAILCLALVGAALALTGRLPGRAPEGQAERAASRMGPMVSLDPFIVNVAGTDGTRYLKAALSVECADKRASSEILQAKYMVRDAIIEALSAQTLRDLTDVARRDAIRQQIADAIDRVLSGGDPGPTRVKGVYFVEFVIQ